MPRLRKRIPPDGYTRPGLREYVTGTGQLVGRVHTPDQCESRNCVIHDPSDHSMRAFPTHWRDDRGIMERICTHGVGHPDPDDMAFHDMVRPGHAEGVHGCDGCCRPVTR